MEAAIAETSSRRKRIVRRALLAVAGAVLLPALYLGSVASLAYAVHAKLLPAWVETSAVTSVYVAPVVWYVNHPQLPGSELSEALIQWARSGEPRPGLTLRNARSRHLTISALTPKRRRSVSKLLNRCD